MSIVFGVSVREGGGSVLEGQGLVVHLMVVAVMVVGTCGRGGHLGWVEEDLLLVRVANCEFVGVAGHLDAGESGVVAVGRGGGREEVVVSVVVDEVVLGLVTTVAAAKEAAVSLILVLTVFVLVIAILVGVVILLVGLFTVVVVVVVVVVVFRF